MKSYKNFMLTQTDDATPDEFQRRYDVYQVEYCQEVSNYFFEKNKCEEWFRERYDPLLQQNMEVDCREWGKSESQKIYDLLASDLTGKLQLALLGPLESTEVSTLGITHFTFIIIICLASLHHFDGHFDRTIFLTGIPANCSKTVLTQSIRAALNASVEEGTNLGLDRLLLAQPTWITRFGPPTFDRFVPHIPSSYIFLPELVG